MSIESERMKPTTGYQAEKCTATPSGLSDFLSNFQPEDELWKSESW